MMGVTIEGLGKREFSTGKVTILINLGVICFKGEK
jgi:hypothetical protein